MDNIIFYSLNLGEFLSLRPILCLVFCLEFLIRNSFHCYRVVFNVNVVLAWGCSGLINLAVECFVANVFKRRHCFHSFWKLFFFELESTFFCLFYCLRVQNKQFKVFTPVIDTKSLSHVFIHRQFTQHVSNNYRRSCCLRFLFGKHCEFFDAQICRTHQSSCNLFVLVDSFGELTYPGNYFHAPLLFFKVV